ncbi:phage tail protein [Paenibacillus sp. FSL W7-1088]|uniref:phage tail protein n=1 Tax=Paenibacillus sp. FSL W7-1088 TaxID=2921695 RepID=UPI0030EBE0FE
MAKETDRLKLPLPLGNENVTRESINGIFEKIDAGVATQAELDSLREAVSKMDIPDASLTQKGKVQLSSKTDGTSETLAATEKAVSDARVAAETNAKNASLPRTGGELTGVLTAPRIDMPNGTSIRTDSTRTSISAAANRFDVISTDGQKCLFSSRSGDFYMYDETGNLITTAKELKQSGVDAKQRVVDAINAKGGSASTNDTWATLQNRIRSIYQGKKFASGVVNVSGTRNFFLTDRDGANYFRSFIQASGVGFIPSTIIAYPTQYLLDSHYNIVLYNNSINVNGYQASFAGEVYRVDGNQAYVRDGSFLLPAYSSGTHVWLAYE